MTRLLEVKNLKTQFATRHGLVKAVDGVSFSVNEGETLALVGESGSGKSVTALSLMRLIQPPGRIVNGDIRFEDEELTAMTEKNIRKIRGDRMAMVFQEPMTSLNPVIPIGRQVTEPLLVHGKISRKEAGFTAERLLSQVQIPDAGKRIGAYPHQFSGGMRQRAMIASAMSTRPRLLIADEPTTALDVTTQAQLLWLMKEITKESASALILITHNLGIVARYADRVCVMYAGKIVETADVKRLYASPHHPYTAGLLESVPRLDRNPGKRLKPIDGQPPDLLNLPEGCAFHPRCPRRIAACSIHQPEMELVINGHEVACFNPILEDLPTC